MAAYWASPRQCFNRDDDDDDNDDDDDDGSDPWNLQGWGACMVAVAAFCQRDVKKKKNSPTERKEKYRYFVKEI